MKPALETVFIQVKDAEGFWSDCGQFPSSELKHAKKYAQFWVKQAPTQWPVWKLGGTVCRVIIGSSTVPVASYAVKGEHETRLES